MMAPESQKPILRDCIPNSVEENHKNKPKYGTKFTLQEEWNEFLSKGLKEKFS